MEKLKAKKAHDLYDVRGGKPTKKKPAKEAKPGKKPTRALEGKAAMQAIHPRGRKPLYPGEHMVVIALNIPASVVAKIDKLTDNRAALVREAISGHLARLRAERKAARA